MMAKNQKKNQYPAYAVKGDDGKLKNTETRIKKLGYSAK